MTFRADRIFPPHLRESDEEKYRWRQRVFELLNGLAFGEMCIVDASLTVTVSVSNTPYEIAEGFTEGNLYLVTVPDDYYLKIGRKGTYKVIWSLSINTATAGNEVEGGVLVNHAVTSSDKGLARATVHASGNEVNLSGVGLFGLDLDDTISLYVRNKTDTSDIVVVHASCVVQWVGL